MKMNILLLLLWLHKAYFTIPFLKIEGLDVPLDAECSLAQRSEGRLEQTEHNKLFNHWRTNP